MEAQMSHEQITKASRLQAIRDTIDNARKYRDGAKYRPQLLLSGIGITLFVLVGVGSALWVRGVRSEQLNNVYRFSRLQEAVTTTYQSNPRSPREDRELYAALVKESEFEALSVR
jgi:hypothetical protein